MPVGAIIGGVASIAGGLIGSSSAKSAAKAQQASNAAAITSQEKMLAQQNALSEPYRQGGITAQNALTTKLGLAGGNTSSADFGSYTKPFDMSTFQQDPGYQFRLDQGNKALEASAAARGGLLSGSALKATAAYSQGQASQEYQNAFNRFQTERQAQIAPLQQMQGVGQAAAAGQAANIGVASAGIANNITGSGEAAASGIVGSSNALTSGINGAANQATNYYNNKNAMSLLGSIYGSGGGAYGIAGSGGIY